MAKIIFTSSDSFMDSDERAVERLEREITGYIECTYDTLRTAPEGRAIAVYLENAWEILGTGERFSDWAVNVH
jgi:hypothetical protein